MFQFFRNFFKTKLGLAISLAFLGLIALAFASADVSSTGTFGGIAGGDRVAVVGDEKISTSDLVRAANNGLEQVRQEQPTATMQPSRMLSIKQAVPCEGHEIRARRRPPSPEP